MGCAVIICSSKIFIFFHIIIETKKECVHTWIVSLKKIQACNNPTVAGLDPKLSYIPEPIRKDAYRNTEKHRRALRKQSYSLTFGIIDALQGLVPAVASQCAYYEAFGWRECAPLAETIAYARQKGMYVITDGKRNDIGTTMEAYAAAHLGQTFVEDIPFTPFGADALTVNGYLWHGWDFPLLTVCENADRGYFCPGKDL